MAPATEHVRCIVCGMGSNRSDWKLKAVRNGVTYVTCDNHSVAEFMAKLPAQKTAAAPSATVTK